MGETQYDIAIIGGGLAGLSLAIQAATAGYRCILFEKEQYPLHRVCGEYISNESKPFLEQLGVPLAGLPHIDALQVTAPNGQAFATRLPLGGFGISRHRLDNLLYQQALHQGATIQQGTRVTAVEWRQTHFEIKAGNDNYTATLVVGSFGKRSNFDVQWQRPFMRQKPGPLNNYIGVKYHIRYPHPENLIALHNFSDGYCGISQVEAGTCCLCYLTTAANLQRSGNSIAEMERQVLQSNPHLRRIFQEAEFLWEAPVTISQISFASKSLVHNHILLTGDAAGMITPLCGNGMSMALHGSYLLFTCMQQFLKGNYNRAQMEKAYTQMWQHQFTRRLQTGRLIQRFFGNPVLSNLLVRSFNTLPLLASPLIRQTHGRVFGMRSDV